ncbi:MULTISPECIES: aldehyde dehydrogenase family protein [Paraburkholderia]|uniref:2-formylbenzoate dehydrogenase n=1 Tax=Paraburkholderia nemoris TaxID=2793076 RepID=A0ABN7N654_9BURK|nr:MULTISPECIES: aldehyde dehydrogenase family protein [Paraburkholderia]MBK5152657.1 aldehyde dehydrogenase family protein [Burkholderia sp. R-69608]MBK5184487.1 aldehyde dehydrogenase family protein [Burkholderia sp. R-69749]MBK3743479.1 aldehyde dehydrogenase family protein [Paraburkholderia aspalathi]MBK3816104.1 aldehyde dehydrogenase family protein [Paraburkholderia aspalathi]CAE6811181.1 2-formylbenzoate dehydrogenase [Paraburkholderia nemoris]
MKLGEDNKRLMLIGGELTASQTGEWLPSINPATEEVIGYTPAAAASDVDAAAKAATQAWPAWNALGVEARGEALREVARQLKARSDEILAVEVADTGNTISALKGDVDAAVWSLNHYAGLGYELKGETIPATPGNLHLTVREPFGVVGRIVPFNHPIMFAAARTAAALMAGNAVVVKPPETSPLSATIFAEICQQVLPPGVMNVVTGLGRDAGDAIARHPDIKRIAFIGSPGTARQIQKSAADVCVKHISLELGGKNPMIVFPDADLERAKDAAVRGMNFAWQGQSCGSTSRLLVHDSLYDEFVESVVARVRQIRLGNPALETSTMGPINSKAQYDKVCNYVEVAKADGARLVHGGRRPEGAGFQRGYWLEPTVFADVTSQMRIAQEEVFGPILSIMRWSDAKQALDIANSVEYGLTASIWTADIGTAMQTARQVRSGYIWINGVGTHFRGVPFGGYKNSGVGREESLDEMLSYTETKVINIML